MTLLDSRVLLLFLLIPIVIPEQFTQYPQGYYPFEESPAKIPPKVRKPPYLQTQVNCPGVGSPATEQTLDNLCGDLNKGYLPLNPTGQSVEGVSYPFEVIKTKTLDFFSKTLPILKADDTLPKVAKYEENHISYHPTLFNSKPSSKITFYHHRSKRSPDEVSVVGAAEDETKRTMKSLDSKEPETQTAAKPPRQSRDWCKDSFGVICMIYNAFSGSQEKASDRIGGDTDVPSLSALNSLDSPMTPCPSAVEYVTPVFAKNYQGVWRYVVQIPYEGYFTQTVEVVKCLSTKCEFMDGSCLASPRWVSLLVAEIYYPDATFPNPNPNPNPTPGVRGPVSQNRNPVQGNSPPSDYNQFFKRSSEFERPTAQPVTTGGHEESSATTKCDGHDEMGCYQVRLYYDWFLIPGSCKCWKNDFFEQYTKKK